MTSTKIFFRDNEESWSLIVTTYDSRQVLFFDNKWSFINTWHFSTFWALCDYNRSRGGQNILFAQKHLKRYNLSKKKYEKQFWAGQGIGKSPIRMCANTLEIGEICGPYQQGARLNEIGNLLLSSPLFKPLTPKCTSLWHFSINSTQGSRYKIVRP